LKKQGGRKKGAKIAVGDIVRIPVGVVFVYLSVTAVVKAFRGFEADFVHIVIAVLAVVVALVFGALGLGPCACTGMDGQGQAREKREEEEGRQRRGGGVMTAASQREGDDCLPDRADGA